MVYVNTASLLAARYRVFRSGSGNAFLVNGLGPSGEEGVPPRYINRIERLSDGRTLARPAEDMRAHRTREDRSRSPPGATGAGGAGSPVPSRELKQPPGIKEEASSDESPEGKPGPVKSLPSQSEEKASPSGSRWEEGSESSSTSGWYETSRWRDEQLLVARRWQTQSPSSYDNRTHGTLA